MSSAGSEDAFGKTMADVTREVAPSFIDKAPYTEIDLVAIGNNTSATRLNDLRQMIVQAIHKYMGARSFKDNLRAIATDSTDDEHRMSGVHGGSLPTVSGEMYSCMLHSMEKSGGGIGAK